MAGGFRIDSLADLPESLRKQAAGKLLAQGTAVLAFAGGVREVFYPEQLTADKLVVGKRGGRR